MRAYCFNTHAAEEKENESYSGLEKTYQSVKLLLISLIHNADTRLTAGVTNKVSYKVSSIIHINYYKGGSLFINS